MKSPYDVYEEEDNNDPVVLPRGYHAIDPTRGSQFVQAAPSPSAAPADTEPAPAPVDPSAGRLMPPSCPECPPCPTGRGRGQGGSLLGLLIGVGLLGGVVYYGGVQLAQTTVSGIGGPDEDGDEPEVLSNASIPVEAIEATARVIGDEDLNEVLDQALGTDLAMHEEEE